MKRRGEMMETLQMIMEMINNFGFPIACVIALAWYAKNTTDKIIILTQEVTKALVSSTDTIEEFKTVVDNMCQKIGLKGEI